jgi:hypothetical protein
MSHLISSHKRYTATGLTSRRGFLVRAGLLIPAAVGLELADGAASLALAAPPIQDRWARCAKCAMLFYNGYTGKGRCPAGDVHVAFRNGSTVRPYHLVYDDSTGPGQGDWRFCRACFALFFNGYPTKGKCAGNPNGHTAAGYNFFLYHDRRAGTHEEENWRFCANCEGLFKSDAAPSVCPANHSRHAAAGYLFVVGQRGGCFDGC